MSVNFKVPDGTLFYPDLGLEDCPPVDGDFCDHLITESNSVLEKYGFNPLTDEDFKVPIRELSSEVGDDLECISSSKAFVALIAPFIQRMGMKVSWEDTSINTNMGNFAEELVLMPGSYYQTYQNTSKVSFRDHDMAYLDVPKLRLAIDVRPGRMNHSSTNDGKASMVASRNAWLPRKSPIKGIYEVFSLYQDVNLGLKRDPRFAYFPSVMAGYGKPLPFKEPSNFRRFNDCYRQGSNKELNNELVRRANRLMTRIGNDPTSSDTLLAHVARFQSQYHDWIKGKSIWCPVTWVDCPDELRVFRVKNLEKPTVRLAASRLMASGLVVSETTLNVRVEHNELCKALLGAENIQAFRKRREEKIAEWKTLSIYSLNSYGYIKEIGLEGLSSKLGDHEILHFYGQLLSRSPIIRTLFRKEDLFWHEALTEVYKNGPMMVHFNCLPKTSEGHYTYAEHKFDIIDTELINKEQELETWLRNQIGPAPRKLISDDEVILGEADPTKIVLIITEDKKLCKTVNKTVLSPVIRVPVEWYYRNLYFGEGGEPWIQSIQEKFPQREVEVFADQGSIDAMEELLFNDGSLLREHASHPFKVTSFDQGKPRLIMQEDYSTGPPMGKPDIFDIRNILAQARKKR
jgi:hypothetical protein